MRNSIGGAWLLGIVITFIAVFVAYITISINYSEAYQMKTKMITVIEQYDGLNPLSVAAITNIAEGYGYGKTSICKHESGETVVGIYNGVARVNPSGGQQICVTREKKYSDASTTEDKYYYNLEVFFGFNLPILGDIFTFRVAGETNAIYYPSSTDYFGA